MYPYRRAKQLISVMLAIVVLGSAILTAWLSNIRSAQAYFPQANIGNQSSSKMVAGEFSGEVNDLVQSVVIDVRVSAGHSDAEQRLSDGNMYLNSSDLELVNDPSVAKGGQSVGLLFSGITIPRGSIINQAYVEFQVDEASSEPTSLVFHGQAVDNAAAFTKRKNDITNRAKTSAAVNWDNIAPWNTVGATVQSADLSSLIQEIVNRSGWAAGNSLALIVDGSGMRVASAYEAGTTTAPLLYIEYLPIISTNTPPPSQPPSPSPTRTLTAPPPTPTSPPPGQATVVQARVNAGSDDAEQRVSDGYMYLNSTDLELVNDPGVALGVQSIGMRFSGLNIPRGSTISRAYVEFQVDEATSETTALVIHGQAADNAATFTSATSNITGRAKTASSVSWNNISAWSAVGAKVQSPDLGNVIQEIVNRSGWAAGNSLALIVDGSGRRVSSAYEAGGTIAPLLHIEYLSSGGTSTPPPPPGPTPTPTRTPTAPPPTPTRTPTTPPPAPTSTPNPQPTPIGQSGNWNLVFRDEFNGSSLDTTKWRTCFWWADTTCSIETNHEMELYNSGDVLVQNGLLRLRAQHRDMTAWNGVIYHYTSGMVMSGGRSGQIPPEFSFTYGYAEALVKVPAGQGLWPAFWMLPTSYNSRPEIDIMEILGHQPDVYHMNYHYVGGDVGQTWTGPDFSAGWHVLGIDWEPNAIVWYVDGVERWRFTDSAHISNQPEYLLLNLAVGGDWPGPPDGSTSFPSYYDIDYVRVWQH